MSIVEFSQIGAAAQPSPSIWKDCPKDQFNEEGTGFYIHEDFFGVGSATDKEMVGQLSTISTGTSVLTQKVGTTLQGGFLNVATGGSDNDANTLYSQPLAQIVLGSGNKVWFECRMEVGALDDRGFFFGLVEQTAMLSTLIADNPSTSAQAGLVGESLLGFVSFETASVASKVDIVTKLDAGTASTILADCTNAATITSQGGTVGNMVAATPKKFGFKFDGDTTIAFYVDGRKVTSYTIVSATFPKNVPMGIALSVKTGTAATKGVAWDWVRAAAQVRR